MRKIIAFVLTACLISSMSLPAFAADINQGSNPKTVEATLTTTVAPTYTVTIPANINITFNVTSTDFGKIELTKAQLDPGHVVRVSAQTAVLKNTADETKTIPYALNTNGGAFAAAEYTAAGQSTALTLDITQDDWNKAYAGQYKGTVTFTVEYISQNG